MFKEIHDRPSCLDIPIPHSGSNDPLPTLKKQPTNCNNKEISLYSIGDSPYDAPVLVAWFCVRCDACSTKTNSHFTTIT